MIRLYDKNEITFGHNETILTPVKCEVTEEENGQFELEYESMPNPMIVAGSIIEAPTPRGPQLFRVYKPSTTLRKTTVKARHIFYDLLGNFIEDSRPTLQQGAGAINAILSGTLYPHRFEGHSTVSTISTAYYVRKNPVQALIGTDNCLVSKWGGYLKRDNFQIRHIPNGRDHGYEIRHGKNLKGVKKSVDDSKVITKVMPTWVVDTVVHFLPEKYIDSPLVNFYPFLRVGEYRVDVPESVEDKETYVRSKANEFFENGGDKPRVNYKIDFITLTNLPEYKDFSWAEDLDLYDIVEVIIPKMDVKLKSNVIKYRYDAINERFVNVEIGNFSESLSKNTATIIKEVEQKIEVKSSELLQKQKEATEKLAGVHGGNIYIKTTADGKPYEIYVMDTDSISTAQNVVRINQNGIGFSSDGVNGIYSVAITVDGHIVADFIDTGTLTADLLKAGEITGATGRNLWNLVTDAFRIGNGDIEYDPITKKTRIKNTTELDTAIVKTANIENGAITNAKIGSIDAYKITTGTIDAQQIRIRNQDLSEFVRGMLPISTAQIGIGSEFKVQGSGANFGANSQYLVINDTGGRGQVLVQGTVAAHGSNYYIEMHSGGLILDRSQMAGVWSNGGYASFRNDRFKFGGKEVYVDGNNFLKVR